MGAKERENKEKRLNRKERIKRERAKKSNEDRRLFVSLLLLSLSSVFVAFLCTFSLDS